MYPYKPQTNQRRQCPCKALLDFLRRLLRMQYRLTVFYYGRALPEHHHSLSLRPLRRKITTLKNVALWTLYLTGPFKLPEREIDFGNDNSTK